MHKSALLTFAEKVKGKGIEKKEDLSWREAEVEERLSHALVKGIVDFIDEDTEEARAKYRRQDISLWAQHKNLGLPKEQKAPKPSADQYE